MLIILHIVLSNAETSPSRHASMESQSHFERIIAISSYHRLDPLRLFHARLCVRPATPDVHHPLRHVGLGLVRSGPDLLLALSPPLPRS